jgi:SAM-dependent methyltransferase
MNLFDIVKRKDRSLVVIAGEITPRQHGGPDGFLGARLGPGAHVRLARADEFACLRTFPRDIGWRLRQPADASDDVSFVIEVTQGARPARRMPLFEWHGSLPNPRFELQLAWPVLTGQWASFDIELHNRGSEPIDIESSPLFATRAALKPLIHGTGVEIGPGMHPFVRPEPNVAVRFVEATPVDTWQSNYGKAVDPAAFDHSLWDHYVIGDGHTLDCCEDNSLDFIFSSHVFEHLMNPLAVLEHWSRKLRRGGAVLSVIPDCRYCFDLRQIPSVKAEWEQEYNAGEWNLPPAKYEKWCRYTAPYNTPRNLIERNYSIHVHYYTPETYRDLADISIERGMFTRIFLNTSPNNKDFGVVLWKE